MKTIIRALCILGLLVMSRSAWSLGLGDIHASSYLGQPLQARIQLIDARADELLTITAALASASDYEIVGMSQNISVPLRFSVDEDSASPGIEVRSRLPVHDPVVQFVVDVRWSGGRMLKEYTVFLDPPTVAAKAPAPIVYRRQDSAPEPPPVEDYPDPDAIDVIETARETTPANSDPETELAQREAAGSQTTAAAAEAGVEPAESARPTSGPPAEPEPAAHEAADLAGDEAPGESFIEEPRDAIPEAAVPPIEEDPPQADPESYPRPVESAPAPVMPAPAVRNPETGGAEYGPVTRGETLWGIASRQVRGTSLSINQAMLAIQRLNPDAFGGNNINRLLQGAILRLPAEREMARISQRQAMVEAMRQAQAYEAMRAGLPFDDSPPVLADLPEAQSAAPGGPAPEPATSPEADPSTEVDTPRLVLVPPSEGERQSVGGTDELDAYGGMSAEELRETLARTEEDLANAQQENEYLAQRIAELEAELERDPLTVEDPGLAAMTDSLREDRLQEETAEAGDDSAPEEPWYLRTAIWLAVLAVLLVSIIVWLIRRTGQSRPDAAVSQVRSDAEAVLETLSADSGEPGQGDEAARAAPLDREEARAENHHRHKLANDPEPEAVELDSDDPETRLDLARAYISVGDPEAAREMLSSVIENGSPEQVSEAREMLDELGR